jgi:hypothetical protein
MGETFTREEMKRDKFITRPILLRTEAQRDIIRRLAESLPCDADKPLEVVFREQVKARKLDQNALMWVGPLKDLQEQCYVNWRKYSAAVWHEHMKSLYLPEEFDAELCKNESYLKWDFSPSGERVLVGSTTELTIKGMSQYLEQIYAFGANHGVEFSANNKY